MISAARYDKRTYYIATAGTAVASLRADDLRRASYAFRVRGPRSKGNGSANSRLTRLKAPCISHVGIIISPDDPAKLSNVRGTIFEPRVINSLPSTNCAKWSRTPTSGMGGGEGGIFEIVERTRNFPRECRTAAELEQRDRTSHFLFST